MSLSPKNLNGANSETDRDSRSRSPTREPSVNMSPKESRNGSAGHGHSREPSKESYRARDRSASHGSQRSISRSRSRSPNRKYRRTRYSRSPRDRKSHRYSRSRSNSREHRSNRRDGGREDPRPNRCLGVFGLSLYTTERQIHHIFSKYGHIDKVQVVLDAKTGRSRGFAFVYYEHVDDATDAKNSCSGMEIDGRKIRADYSITERPHTPTPGIYMGRPSYGSSYGGRRGGGGGGGSRYGGGGYGYGRRRSPSPYRRRAYRSRSRSYSPRRSRY